MTAQTDAVFLCNVYSMYFLQLSFSTVPSIPVTIIPILLFILSVMYKELTETDIH